MTKHIEPEWVQDVLNQDELAQYVKFEKSFDERFTKEDQQQFEDNWAALVKEMQQHLNDDPTSETAIALAKRCMDMADEIYGQEFARLRIALWEKGMRPGKDQGQHGLSPELAEWLDKAIEAYWFEKIFMILNQAGPDAPKHLRNDWQNLLDEMFGDYQQGVDELIAQLMIDEHLSKNQRDWLLL